MKRLAFCAAAATFVLTLGGCADNFKKAERQEKQGKRRAAIYFYNLYVAKNPSGKKVAEAHYRIGLLEDGKRALADLDKSLAAGYSPEKVNKRRIEVGIEVAESNLDAGREILLPLASENNDIGKSAKTAVADIDAKIGRSMALIEEAFAALEKRDVAAAKAKLTVAKSSAPGSAEVSARYDHVSARYNQVTAEVSAQEEKDREKRKISEYKDLREAVRYWFDLRESNSGDYAVWKQIVSALEKTTYGNNEFELRRDAKNVEARFQQVTTSIYGIKFLMRLPAYNFEAKAYDLSGEPKLNEVRGIFKNGRIQFPLVRVGERQGEQIQALNKGSYYQEILFRPVRMQTREEALNEMLNSFREISIMTGGGGRITQEAEREARVLTQNPHTAIYSVVASKIVLKGFGEVYSQ